MEKIVLSIITPFYRGYDHINKMMQVSHFCASYPEVEYIIVDDGTPVDSNKSSLLDQVPCSKLIRQKNSGPAAARKNGLLESRGEYVYFLDCDDLPNFETLKSLIYNTKLLTLDGVIILNENIRNEIVPLSKALSVLYLISGVLDVKIAPSNFLVSRKIALKSPFYSLSWGEDIPWIIGILFNAPSIVIFKCSVERYFSPTTRGVTYSLVQVFDLVKSVWRCKNLGFWRYLLSVLVSCRFSFSWVYKKVFL